MILKYFPKSIIPPLLSRPTMLARKKNYSQMLQSVEIITHLKSNREKRLKANPPFKKSYPTTPKTSS